VREGKSRITFANHQFCSITGFSMVRVPTTITPRTALDLIALRVSTTPH
jgi:hypothetical protein